LTWIRTPAPAALRAAADRSWAAGVTADTSGPRGDPEACLTWAVTSPKGLVLIPYSRCDRRQLGADGAETSSEGATNTRTPSSCICGSCGINCRHSCAQAMSAHHADDQLRLCAAGNDRHRHTRAVHDLYSSTRVTACSPLLGPWSYFGRSAAPIETAVGTSRLFLPLRYVGSVWPIQRMGLLRRPTTGEKVEDGTIGPALRAGRAFARN
jgi:hypothetical protein